MLRAIFTIFSTCILVGSLGFAQVAPAASVAAKAALEGKYQIAKGLYAAGSAGAAETKASVDTCYSTMTTAHNACMEDFSPKIIEGVTAVNAILSAAQTVGLVDACSKYSKAMNIASGAMTAFTAECAYFKNSCATSCQAADTAAQTSLTTASSAVPAETVKVSGLKATTAFTKAAIANCNGYSTTLISAGVGIVKIIANLQQSKQCEKQNTVTATPTPIDCTLAANTEVVECICKRAPRTAGCDGSSGNTVVSNTSSTTSIGVAKDESTTPVPALTFDRDTNTQGFTAGGGVSGAGGSVAGGAAGGAGSGGGSAKAGDGTKSGSKSALNGNILQGDMGGGGGGSRSASSSGSDDKYKAYMPGGEKDPSRGTASAAARVNEVTGAGGEDNFKKVSNRYRDSKGTLLGD